MITLPDEANHSYQEVLTISFDSSTSLPIILNLQPNI